MSGMGKDIYENFDKAREIYDRASHVVGIDISKICFEGPEEELNKTENTQIAILVTSLAMLEVLKEKGIKPDVAAGLSLGEYTALIYSGAISLEEGIKLVRKRGQLMQSLVPKGNWKMAAILGLENEVVENICENINEKVGFVVPANYNYQGQIVVSGEEKAVEKVIRVANEKGAKRAILLNTSGPFHTKKLEEAKVEFQKELENINVNQSNITVIKNMDGLPYKEEDNIKGILADHMVSPVRFDKTIEYILESGIETFIEIGPGKTLTGFIRKVNKDVYTININNLDSLKELIV